MQIPGYEIEREIGRGGMARVYLAVQTKFGRWVALKVVSSAFARDDQFRKRFLQESRINGQLTHPNVVQVHDVGAHDDLLYLVMEYLSGGDLNARLDSGMHVRDLVKVVKDIGRALDYAHDKRIIHRDIKPENILFRDDGSAVLTDFGIARLAAPELTLTRSGTVVGTPQYMSPEQAAGRPLDGRSDLYSLGVVFFRMLTGDVPYKAESAVAIGVKHLQEPIPKLPSYLSPFQSVIDSALAKDPDDRFQSGAALGEALEQIEAGDMVPNATIRTQAVTTQEIRAVGSTLLTAVRDKPRDGPAKGGGRGASKLRTALPLVLAGALVIGASLILTQKPEWVSQAMAQLGLTDQMAVDNAWNSARSLHDDPNQSLTSIVAGYRRVLDLAPDHFGAQEALTGLASQWKESVREALTVDNLTLAQTKLDESLDAFPDDPVLPELSLELENRQQAQTLLGNTAELLASRGLSDLATATAAIQAYQEVLRLVPDHAAARAELARLGDAYRELAIAAAQRRDVDQAIGYLDRAIAANPDSPDLDEVRDLIRDATELTGRNAELLAQASAFRAEGALINPAGQNAAELYRMVLATDPSNSIALQGINEVSAQLASRTIQRLDEKAFDDAARLVDRASAAGIDPDVVAQMRTQLQTARDRQGRLDTLLARAQERMALGYLTQPEQDNAVSALRQIQQLDPGNPAATALLAEIAEQLAAVAEQAYAVGMITQARTYLDLALTVTPDVPDWRAKREAWMAAESAATAQDAAATESPVTSSVRTAANPPVTGTEETPQGQ
ncbi:MAG: protein kinase [Pseudomonadota bacterium]